ncbi:hypothetical protein QN277_003601 [Acacia crassicarpa]|uniref:Non-haem dioxygenase N-terminal domain-containing protein n=1 Tax=Acacia crassicarpa TaxID=499986 RepID=A0AAE1MCW1_9FABA|nr:hypothetical protein QN277_003601 [Acacia crassicarpa]
MGEVFEQEKKKEGLKVPTVDLKEMESEDEEVRRYCKERLKKAAEEWGVIQLVNHGIPIELINAVKESREAFFFCLLKKRRSTLMNRAPPMFKAMEASLPIMPVDSLSGKITYSTLFSPEDKCDLSIWPKTPSHYT